MSTNHTRTAALVVAAALVPVGLAVVDHAAPATSVAAGGTALAGRTDVLPGGQTDGQNGTGSQGDSQDGSQDGATAGDGGSSSGTGQGTLPGTNGWGGTGDRGVNRWGGSTGQGATGMPWDGSGNSGFGSGGFGGRATRSGTVSGTPLASAKGVVLVDTQLPGGQGAGTGITLTADGTVLTNYHVVEGSTKIQVTDSTTHRTYAATIVGRDRTHDIAVLRLTGASGLSTAVVNGPAASVGDAVTAVGQGGGRGILYAAQGTVTSTDESITAGDENGMSSSERLTGLVETSADVVPGYSGGPLLDTAGRVVGVDTAASSGGDVTGYAVPISRAMSIAKQIIAGQRSDTVHIGPRAGLGISVSAGTQGTQGGQGVQGAPVLSVSSGSAAAAAGITTGSVITGVNGTAVTSSSELTDALADDYPGTRVTVAWTDAQGVSHTRAVTLGTSQAG